MMILDLSMIILTIMKRRKTIRSLTIEESGRCAQVIGFVELLNQHHSREYTFSTLSIPMPSTPKHISTASLFLSMVVGE